PCCARGGNSGRDNCRGQDDEGGDDESQQPRLSDLSDVAGYSVCESNTENNARADADAGNRQSLQQNIGEDVSWLRAERHANTKLARAAADGKRKHTSNTNDRDEESHGGESAEDNRVQLIGGHYLSANVVKCTGLLDGLFG